MRTATPSAHACACWPPAAGMPCIGGSVSGCPARTSIPPSEGAARRPAGGGRAPLRPESRPGGFAWAVPVWRAGGFYVRVGVMAERDAPTYFARMLERIAGRWVAPARSDGRPRQKILPLASLARTYRDRLIAIGDAAGLVKPTTGGGGVYYGLLSAAIGAEVANRALAEDALTARDLSEYQRLWQRRLKPELDAQMVRSGSWRGGCGNIEIEGLFELARTDGVMPIVQRAAEFNRHRRLIVALLRHQPARQLFFQSFVS